MALMKIRPYSLRDQVVCRVSDEDVIKPVAGFIRELRPPRADQRAVDERSERSVQLTVITRHHQLRGCAAMKAASLDRRRLEHGTVGLWKPVDAGGQDRLDRARDGVRRGSQLRSHRHHLLKEE